VIRSTSRPLYPERKCPWYPKNGMVSGHQSCSESFGEEKNICLVPGIEPIFLGCPARNPVTILTALSRHKLFVGLIRRTACVRAQFSGCSSTTNAHSETGQTAVCCQNLPLGVLRNHSAPCMLVGELFKKFGLFFEHRCMYIYESIPLSSS
jgi:hypothetical protein